MKRTWVFLPGKGSPWVLHNSQHKDINNTPYTNPTKKELVRRLLRSRWSFGKLLGVESPKILGPFVRQRMGNEESRSFDKVVLVQGMTVTTKELRLKRHNFCPLRLGIMTFDNQLVKIFKISNLFWISHVLNIRDLHEVIIPCVHTASYSSRHRIHSHSGFEETTLVGHSFTYC